MNRRELVVAALVVAACTSFVTWPQAVHFGSQVAAHDDSMFSMWRIAWIAHALRSDPSRLFHGNTFHPSSNTLAFSDATLLEGLIAAPFIWLGVPIVPVYNALLFLGFAGSGLAMFLLARRVSGSYVAALIGAAIFTLAPYRVEHFMHLELQWTMWTPLALWALHRSTEDGSARHGILCGLFLWLQVLSCVYYGVFLAIVLGVLGPAMLLLNRRRVTAALPGLAGGAVLALLLTWPYARPYIEVSQSFGQRDVQEIASYSARLGDYALSPPTSLLWGWTSDAAGPERKLSFGAVATVLAVLALGWKPRKALLLYVALAVLAIELSMGVNGTVYPWLVEAAPPLLGLRSLARFGVIAACAVAVLAALGSETLLRAAGTGSRRAAVATAIFCLLAVDSAQTGQRLMPLAANPPNAYTVYKAVRSLGVAPVMELPMPKLNRLPGREAFYTFWSIGSWHPLVNGYSGYFPPEYVQTAVRTEHFPDDRSFAQLRHLGVRYVVVHRDFYAPAEYIALMERMRARPELRHYGTFPAPSGAAELFLVEN
jgi:hypothetical protein